MGFPFRKNDRFFVFLAIKEFGVDEEVIEADVTERGGVTIVTWLVSLLFESQRSMLISVPIPSILVSISAITKLSSMFTSKCCFREGLAMDSVNELREGGTGGRCLLLGDDEADLGSIARLGVPLEFLEGDRY